MTPLCRFCLQFNNEKQGEWCSSWYSGCASVDWTHSRCLGQVLSVERVCTDQAETWGWSFVAGLAGAMEATPDSRRARWTIMIVFSFSDSFSLSLLPSFPSPSPPLHMPNNNHYFSFTNVLGGGGNYVYIHFFTHVTMYMQVSVMAPSWMFLRRMFPRPLFISSMLTVAARILNICIVWFL